MSVKTFKPHFHQSYFEGPLASHYDERQDLFQQFIGAFLRERFGTRVQVSPTKGQDGSIDIFVEVGSDPNETFLGLSFPIIVECKDHDDTLGKVFENVLSGWKKVEKKLTNRSNRGWEGKFEPWKNAKSYLYIVSAVMPHAQSRNNLGKSIKDFFSNLSPTQKPAIEQTKLVDWSDLQPQFNENSRLVDCWLGIAHSGIIGHEDYEVSLTGFRGYLKEKQLPYVYPDIDDPTHPKKLLAELTQNAGHKGVMLVGAGGVGKTRTCYEVAKLADNQGWRVLHIIPGEPAVTIQDIENTVLQGATKTLLVFDYLEQLGSIDWGSMRHRCLTDAKLRSVTIAFLANARSGIVLRDGNIERDALFDRKELTLKKERKERISASIQRTLAPLASHILGSERVIKLCGTRPIIGMFIARELERLASQGRLDESAVASLRGGDLQTWINRRFQEDGLTAKVTEELLPPTPSTLMIASAAGLAAAPLSQNHIESVLTETLSSCGETSPKNRAMQLLRTLICYGWLEEHKGLIYAPHDVVADELLEQILYDRAWQSIRHEITEQALSSAISSPRVLGRFSVSLDRILGKQELAENIRQQLKNSLNGWLEQHSNELGKILLQNPIDEVSYALGGVVTSFTWQQAAFKSWTTLITPWLASNSNSVKARHLFHRGLKGLPEQKADKLTISALEWLKTHHLNLEAGFVLAPLLGRTDLSNKEIQQAITKALFWLDKYYETQDAEFVLKKILGTSLLTNEQKLHCIKLAILRLEKIYLSEEASFLLRHCLKERDLTGQEREIVVTSAVKWLRAHSMNRDIDFVFTRLLRNPTIEDAIWREVADIALVWIKNTPITHPSLDHTFNSFVARPKLLYQAEKADIESGIHTWLKTFPNSKEKKRLHNSLNILNNDKLWRTLSHHAEMMTAPEIELLEQGLDSVTLNMAKNHPSRAGFLLELLLPLASRIDNETFYNRIYAEVTEFLMHPYLTEKQKKGFFRASYKLLEKGAWVEWEVGKANLEALGIENG